MPLMPVMVMPGPCWWPKCREDLRAEVFGELGDNVLDESEPTVLQLNLGMTP